MIRHKRHLYYYMFQSRLGLAVNKKARSIYWCDEVVIVKMKVVANCDHLAKTIIL